MIHNPLVEPTKFFDRHFEKIEVGSTLFFVGSLFYSSYGSWPLVGAAFLVFLTMMLSTWDLLWRPPRLDGFSQAIIAVSLFFIGIYVILGVDQIDSATNFAAAALLLFRPIRSIGQLHRVWSSQGKLDGLPRWHTMVTSVLIQAGIGLFLFGIALFLYQWL